MRNDMMSREEAAEYLGVSPRWLSTHKSDGPVATRIGGKVFYLKQDLDAYISAQRGKPVTPKQRRKRAAAAPAAAPQKAAGAPEPTRQMSTELLGKMLDASERTSPPPLPPPPGRLTRRNA
jgi:hypothetical protein